MRYHFAIMFCFVFCFCCWGVFCGGGGFKCPCYRIIDDVIGLLINFCCDTINCNGDNEIRFLFQIYLRSSELTSDIKLSFYFQKRYQIYFQNLRVCIQCKTKSVFYSQIFSFTYTCCAEKNKSVMEVEYYACQPVFYLQCTFR